MLVMYMSRWGREYLRLGGQHFGVGWSESNRSIFFFFASPLPIVPHFGGATFFFFSMVIPNACLSKFVPQALDFLRVYWA